MTITTEDCRQAIRKYVNDDTDWKRKSKYKDNRGRWVRLFEDPEFINPPVYVVETELGLVVTQSPPGETWYFQVYKYDGYTTVDIVSKSFYDRSHSMDDRHIAHQLEGLLPEGFDEDCESTFTTRFTMKQAREKLLTAGFVEKKFPWHEDDE